MTQGMSKRAARKLAVEREFTPRELLALVAAMEATEEPSRVNPNLTRANFKAVFTGAFNDLPLDEPLTVEKYSPGRRRYIRTSAFLLIVNVLRELGAPPEAALTPTTSATSSIPPSAPEDVAEAVKGLRERTEAAEDNAAALANQVAVLEAEIEEVQALRRALHASHKEAAVLQEKAKSATRRADKNSARAASLANRVMVAEGERDRAQRQVETLLAQMEDGAAVMEDATSLLDEQGAEIRRLRDRIAELETGGGDPVLRVDVDADEIKGWMAAEATRLVEIATNDGPHARDAQLYRLRYARALRVVEVARLASREWVAENTRGNTTMDGLG